VSSKKVTRLPIQHPTHPHCPSCGVELPNFENAQVLIGPDELKGSTLVGIGFHIRCQCGVEWVLAKTTK
jgi:hypothetical protein